MAAGKNQHYVPQRYFRMFSQDGKSIRVLRLSDGLIIPSASIKGQASKPWFYGDTSTENRLAEAESLSGSSLNDIATCTDINALSKETLEKFLIWLVMQRARTESSRIASRDTDTAMTRMLLEAEINSNSNYSDEEKSRLRDALQLVYSVDSTMQLMRMKIAIEQVPSLFDLNFVLIKNNSDKPFIFGDAPCVYYNLLRKDIDYKGVLGTQSLGLLIIFPLTPKLMAILYDGLSYKVRKASNGFRTTNLASDITSLNKLQLHAASNCVYYTDNTDDKYIKYLWETEKNNFSENKLIGREFDKKERKDGTSSSIFMTYEPQLPINLNLSFLTKKNITFPEEINTRSDFINYQDIIS